MAGMMLEKLENGWSKKLPEPSLNRIVNALSIGVQCTHSFRSPDFSLRCLVIQVI